MPRPFVPLHVHSHWSFLAGAWAPEEIARAAARRGMPAVALTDTDGLYGAVPFAKACEAAGVKPIVGAEVTAPPEGRPTRSRRAVLLARDAAGYEALCAILSARHLDDGFDLVRAVAERAEGVIALVRDHRLMEAAVAAGRREGLWAEVRPAPPGDSPTAVAERRLRRETLGWARRLGVPPVATTAAHYETPEDRRAHETLRAIALNDTLDAVDARAGRGERAPGDLETGPYAPETAWFQDGEALAGAFADCPEAPANAAAIAAACSFSFEWGTFRFPAYPTPAGESAFATVWRLAFEGLTGRYRPLPPEAIRRLTEELEVIEERGFADYFLAIREIAAWARENHVPTVGRGSAANSLVSFCLGITRVDPLRHDLFFERFLSREREDPPDFDLDFCWRRRDRVIEHVYERWGAERVAMVATACRLGARGAIREAARALGIPDGEISAVTKRIPRHADAAMVEDLRRALPECRDLPFDRPPWDEALERALEIDGAPRHPGVHPGGIVIAPGAVDRFVPRRRAAKGVVTTHFDMDPIADVGLVKIDLLGNRGLSAIADACDLVREAEGVELAWADREDEPEGEAPGRGALTTVRRVNPFADPATRRLMREGRTMGCFYIESPGMRALLRKLSCDTFETLTAASSIIRPGISDSGMMDAFVRRFRGEEEVTWLHPVMEELLADTWGVMIYQEDVMKVVHRLAGMTLGEADAMRRSMAKKGDYEDLSTYERRFLEGCRENGVAEGVAREIWRQIASFAGYSFCKAHSASYARISFRSAWLKANLPAAFLAATLANGGGYYPAFAYVEEARRTGLEIRLPDVNRSGATWRAEDPDGRAAGEAAPVAAARAIRAGLGQIAEVEAETVERILAEREARGAFASLADFRVRVPLGLAELYRLVDAGCFDAFDLTRPQAKWKAEAMEGGSPGAPGGGSPAGPAPPAPRVAERPGGRTLFGAGAWREMAAEPPPVPALADYPPGERRRREWELLGVSVHHHPIEFWREEVAAARRGAAGRPGGAAAILAGSLHRYAGRRVTMVGFLTTTKRVRTKRAEPMMFLTLEDETGIWDVVLFPRAYRRYGDRLVDRGPYVVVGRVEEDARPSSVTAERVERLEAW